MINSRHLLQLSRRSLVNASRPLRNPRRLIESRSTTTPPLTLSLRWFATTDTTDNNDERKQHDEPRVIPVSESDNPGTAKANDNNNSDSDYNTSDSDSDTEQDNKQPQPKTIEDEFQTKMDQHVPPPTIPAGEKREFQAETRQLLDIVTNSLYTDKDVFLRELVSNASDSLEKLRHMQATNQVNTNSAKQDDELPLEIRIELDEVASTITISDTGIGMNADEMILNLGTIAKSGSKQFIQQMEGGNQDIIGKFGVGFYSAFMVGQRVEFRSRSALADPSEPAKVWSSDGSGTYEVVDLPDDFRQNRGSSIVIHVKDVHWDYVDEAKVEGILKRYSNYINFPVYLNGKKVNTMKALWSVDPKEVTKDEHSEFYKYLTNGFDDPLETYHFRVDAPVDIKALFYIPSFHSERNGMERLQPGVSIYSRKVLIEHKSRDILPDWLRFIKGAVDSEDLPLSISREKPQDTALIKRLRKTLTRKIVAHLATMAKKDPKKYLKEFYSEYAFFLKEGICQDEDFKDQLSKLLRFETSKVLTADDRQEDTDMHSLDDYVSRMKPEQEEIYYLIAPSREAAISSPYLEAFLDADVEVVLLYTAIDDFVMNSFETYEGRKMKCIENSDIDLSKITGKVPEKKKTETGDKLTSAECLEFCSWFKKKVGERKVASCTVTDRLKSSPAIVVDNDSSAMRRMMRYVDTQDGKESSTPLQEQKVEINPSHPVIIGIHRLSKTEPILAETMAEQVFDNCLMAAGLMEDARSMLPRLNGLMQSLINTSSTNMPPDAESDKVDNVLEPEPVSVDASPANKDDPVHEAEYTDKTNAAKA